jgi:hypothetical protein
MVRSKWRPYAASFAAAAASLELLELPICLMFIVTVGKIRAKMGEGDCTALSVLDARIRWRFNYYCLGIRVLLKRGVISLCDQDVKGWWEYGSMVTLYNGSYAILYYVINV